MRHAGLDEITALLALEKRRTEDQWAGTMHLHPVTERILEHGIHPDPATSALRSLPLAYKPRQ